MTSLTQRLSSGSVGAVHDTAQGEFANGRVYRYAEVPRSVYAWLLRTPKKGAFVSRMIVDRYAHRDVTPAPVLPDVETALRASLDAHDEPPED